MQAQSGFVDSVILYAQAQATATQDSNEFARAVADPTIFVDPAFPNASLYSIVVSPGWGTRRSRQRRRRQPYGLWVLCLSRSGC